MVFGELMECFGSAPACYVSFASAACVSCEYSPLGPAILENVLETHMILLAQG